MFHIGDHGSRITDNVIWFRKRPHVCNGNGKKVLNNVWWLDVNLMCTMAHNTYYLHASCKLQVACYYSILNPVLTLWNQQYQNVNGFSCLKLIWHCQTPIDNIDNKNEPNRHRSWEREIEGEKVTINTRHSDSFGFWIGQLNGVALRNEVFGHLIYLF